MHIDLMEIPTDHFHPYPSDFHHEIDFQHQEGFLHEEDFLPEHGVHLESGFGGRYLEEELPELGRHGCDEDVV